MIIRQATITDTDQLRDIYAPYVQNTPISFETTVPSAEEMEKRISGVISTNPWLVIAEGNNILGYAYASKHRERAAYRWSVDVSVYVRQECRGMGIGKLLYTALLNILRHQGYCNVYAGIGLPNEASTGIHEYFGFRKIAHYTNVGYKMGQWRDVGWWELFLANHTDKPEAPLPISSISKETLSVIFAAALESNNSKG